MQLLRRCRGVDAIRVGTSILCHRSTHPFIIYSRANEAPRVEGTVSAFAAKREDGALGVSSLGRDGRCLGSVGGTNCIKNGHELKSTTQREIPNRHSSVRARAFDARGGIAHSAPTSSRFSPGEITARLQTESARTREWPPLAFAIRRERGAASPHIVMARDASPARVRVRS